MSEDKKNKNRKQAGKQQVDFYNDQLGENAAEHFNRRYNNKDNRKKK